MTALRRAARWPVLLLIRFYQRVISPWTPPSCRYYPSCSQYAYVAVERHGLLRGGWLAVRRLGRCHPWAAGGVDHVPPVKGAERSGPGADPETRDDVHRDIHNDIPSGTHRDIHSDVDRDLAGADSEPGPAQRSAAADLPLADRPTAPPMIARGA